MGSLITQHYMHTCVYRPVCNFLSNPEHVLINSSNAATFRFKHTIPDAHMYIQ